MKIPSVSIPSTLLCFSLAISPAVLAQSSELLPKLTGIARIGDRECVVLEVPQVLRPGTVLSRTLILQERERESEVEVVSIKADKGTAALIYHGSNVLVRLSVANPSSPARNQINLTNAALDAVLKIYEELADRTLLVHPGLWRTNLALAATSEDRSPLAAILASALTNVGIVSIPDGEKFLRIVPAALAQKAHSQLQCHIRTTNELKSADELFPPGAVDFIAAKGGQVAKVYAELVGKKLDQSSAIPYMQDFICRIHPALTRAEIVYALDVQFAWRGVKLVEVDDHRVRIVPLEEK